MIQRTSTRLAAALFPTLIALALAAPAPAQCEPHWLPGFSAPGATGSVFAALATPEGDVIVGGQFAAVGATPAAGIAKWDHTTGAWSALGGGLNGRVYAIALIPSATGAGSDVLVGGQFTRANGNLARNIARYSPATGQWSAIGSGCNDAVFALQPIAGGGDVLVAGAFTLAGGQGCGRLARLTPATNAWAPAGGDGVFRSTSSYAIAYALAPLPGGDVMVGGGFDTAGTMTSPAMARYRPSTDEWFFAGSESDYSVRALATLPNGDVAAGGTHSGSGVSAVGIYNVASGNWVYRYSTLTLSGTGYGFSSVTCLTVFGNTLLVGGNFSSIDGVTAYGIARLNIASGVWASLNSNLVYGNGAYPPNVNAIALLPQGDTVIAGGFTYCGQGAAYNLARLDGTGVWHPMADGVTTAPSYLLPIGNGDVLVGGNLGRIGTIPHNYAAIYHAPTRTWSSISADITAPVGAAAMLPDGRLWIATYTATLSAQTLLGLYICDLSTGSVVQMVDGQLGVITQIRVLPNGDAVVSGSFTSLGGTTVNNIARVSAANGTVTTLGAGLNNTVFDTALLPSGDLVAAGRFTASGAAALPRLARYNFTTHAWSAMAAPDNEVYALATDGAGNMYAGGTFSTAGNVNAQYIARWNSTTQQWFPVAGGTNGTVYALSVGADNSVLVGGNFTATGVGGIVPAGHIARYEPATDSWSAFGTGTDGRVFRVAQANRNEILGTGEIAIAGGVVSNTLAHFSTHPTCAADFNCSGAVSAQDIFDFLNAWFAHDSTADLDGYGFTQQDILAFLNVWFTGCS